MTTRLRDSDLACMGLVHLRGRLYAHAPNPPHHPILDPHPGVIAWGCPFTSTDPRQDAGVIFIRTGEPDPDQPCLYEQVR